MDGDLRLLSSNVDPGRRPLAGAGRLRAALPGPAPAQEGGVARRAAHAARGQRLRPPHHRAHVGERQHRARRPRSQREGAVPRGPGAGPGDGGGPPRRRSTSPPAARAPHRRHRRRRPVRRAARTTSSPSRWAAGSRSSRPTRKRRPRGSSSISWPLPLAAGEPSPSPTATASAAPRLPVPEGPAVRTVVIDPGHGGDDVGAKGPGGTLEKDVTLAIARKVRAAVANTLGLQAFLTRDKDQDVALDERAARSPTTTSPTCSSPSTPTRAAPRARAGARSTSCPTRPATTRAGAWPRWKAGRCRPGPAHPPAPTWR